MTRCPWAVNFGALSTRCELPEGHALDAHQGSGLSEFPYQKISWMPGDRREFLTDRTDDHAWEEPPI